MLEKWSQKYQVYNEKLDTDHKKLFDIISEIAQIVYFDSKNKSRLISTFQKLQDYTVYHFGREEDILKKYQYPKLEEHRKEHNKLISHLEKNLYTIEAVLYEKDEIIQFLENWLTNHILQFDIEYSKDLFQK